MGAKLDRRYSGSQTNQGEVLDDCSHVLFASKTLRSKSHVTTIASFFGREFR